MGIHATAVVASSVDIDSSNEIGPYCVIEEGVKLGRNNRFRAHVHICGGTTIGDDNDVHTGAVLGDDPQDLGYRGDATFLEIGSGNVIREHATLHRGTAAGTATRVGDRCMLMAGSHIGHNCTVADAVILVNHCALGGHVEIETGAFLSGQTALHQYVRVGRFAMLSGLSAVNQDVPPFTSCGGRPARALGINVVALRRNGFSAAARLRVQKAHRVLFGSAPLPERLEQLSALEGAEAAEIVRFIQASKRGIIEAQVARKLG